MEEQIITKARLFNADFVVLPATDEAMYSRWNLGRCQGVSETIDRLDQLVSDVNRRC